MAEQEKDPLFPALPEDLKSLSDAEVQKLLDDHVSAAALIDADDDEFLADYVGAEDEIIAQYEAGVAAVKVLQAENKERIGAYEAYQAEKAKNKAELEATLAEEEPEPEEPSEPSEPAEPEAEVTAEADTEPVAEETVEENVESGVAEPVAVTASTASNTAPPRFSRTPPAPSKERIVVNEPVGTALVAAGEMSLQFKDNLTPDTLAQVVKAAAVHHGPHPKVDAPGKYRFGGPEHKIARAEFQFPEERVLDGDVDGDIDKIRQALPSYVNLLGKPGGLHGEALTASGGLCAPLTPIYTMPNFATEAEPVWDSLPVFQAARGGVNVPDATYIADITTAISSISESEDAQGGTFATKSCQALECPDYTEVAVQILAHCREYGNLNARAWPEKIAHENALTMAALSRTTETFMLDRIKTLSINVTQAAIGTQYGSFASLVHAIVKASAGTKFRLRMPRTTNCASSRSSRAEYTTMRSPSPRSVIMRFGGRPGLCSTTAPAPDRMRCVER